MSGNIIHPPGDKVARAIKEFSDLIQSDPEQDKKILLQKIIIEFDLSPKECDFMERHLK